MLDPELDSTEQLTGLVTLTRNTAVTLTYMALTYRDLNCNSFPPIILALGYPRIQLTLDLHLALKGKPSNEISCSG